MHYSLLSIFLLGIILLSCSSNQHKPSDPSLETEDVSIDTSTQSSSYPLHNIFNENNSISDGEAEHTQTLSQEEMKYHAKRGVSTLEDAYLEGYEDGYEDGEEDGSRGKRHGHSYDPDSDFTGKFEDSYNSGYEDGYNDGYYSSLDKDDEEDYDE